MVPDTTRVKAYAKSPRFGTVVRGARAASAELHAVTHLVANEPLAAAPQVVVGDGAPFVDAEQVALRQAGYDDGYRAGLIDADATIEEGRRAAAEEAWSLVQADGVQAAEAVATEARGRIDRAVASLHAAAGDLAERDAVSLDEVEHRAVTLAFALTEALLGRELALAVSPGTDAVKRALSIVPDRGELLVRLNPADLAGVDASALAPGRAVTLVGDPNVEPAGCVVEVGAARIDAQLGPALDRARSAIGLAAELEIQGFKERRS